MAGSTKTPDASQSGADGNVRSSKTGSNAGKNTSRNTGPECAGRHQTATKPAIVEKSPLWALQFSCLRDAAYHEMRERFYSRSHKFILFVIVISGAAAFQELALAFDVIKPSYGVALATLAGLLDLVFDIGGKARQHSNFRWRAMDIYTASLESGAPVEKLNLSLVRMYADEPTSRDIVNHLAYNIASMAMNGDPSARYKVGRIRRFFKNWF